MTTILKGLPASKGIVEGTIKKYAIGLELNKGEIVAVHSATPEMSIEIIKASAVIAEKGGMLSHIAIFCRELEIPCIIGIDGLMEKITDGSKARIDGSTGIIEIK